MPLIILPEAKLMIRDGELSIRDAGLHFSLKDYLQAWQTEAKVLNWTRVYVITENELKNIVADSYLNKVA